MTMDDQSATRDVATDVNLDETSAAENASTADDDTEATYGPLTREEIQAASCGGTTGCALRRQNR